MGYICSCHALIFVRSLQCLRSSVTVRSGSAIPEPCCFLDSDHRTFGCPLLPCATRVCPTESSVSAYGKLRFCLREAPPLPYGKLRFCLRKAPPLPYGKLRFCLRKAPPLPLRKAPFLPTESSASVYEELHFSFSLCITSCNKLSFPQLNPPVFIVTLASWKGDLVMYS